MDGFKRASELLQEYFEYLQDSPWSPESSLAAHGVYTQFYQNCMDWVDNGIDPVVVDRNHFEKGVAVALDL